MTPRDLRAQRAQIIQNAQALASAETFGAEQQAQFDAMMADAEKLQAQYERIERAASLTAELGSLVNARAATGTSAPVVADAGTERRILAAIRAGRSEKLVDADKSHFADVVARDCRILTAMGQNGGVARLSADDAAHYSARFQNASSTTTNGAGYTISPLFEAELLVAMKAFGGMRAAARVISTDTGATLPWPTMDDTGNVASIISGENVQVTADTDLVFNQVNIGAYTYRSGLLPISLQLLQDSAFDFDSLIKGAMAMRFARGQNTHFTVGTGSGQPTGVVTSAVVGQTGATGQTVTVTWQDLVELQHSVDPAYRPGAVFMMHDTTVKALKKLVDGQNRPLFLPGITSGAPDTILGIPLSVNQDMPVMAANAKSILFGNFNNYVIRDTLGVQMMTLRERFADFLQVAYMGYARTDGKLISAASPIKAYKNSAT